MKKGQRMEGEFTLHWRTGGVNLANLQSIATYLTIMFKVSDPLCNSKILVGARNRERKMIWKKWGEVCNIKVRVH